MGTSSCIYEICAGISPYSQHTNDSHSRLLETINLEAQLMQRKGFLTSHFISTCATWPSSSVDRKSADHAKQKRSDCCTHVINLSIATINSVKRTIHFPTLRSTNSCKNPRDALVHCHPASFGNTTCPQLSILSIPTSPDSTPSA